MSKPLRQTSAERRKISDAQAVTPAWVKQSASSSQGASRATAPTHITSSASANICHLCRRQFASADQLSRHERESKLHAENLEKQRRERLGDHPVAGTPVAADSTSTSSDPTGPVASGLGSNIHDLYESATATSQGHVSRSSKSKRHSVAVEKVTAETGSKNLSGEELLKIRSELEEPAPILSAASTAKADANQALKITSKINEMREQTTAESSQPHGSRSSKSKRHSVAVERITTESHSGDSGSEVQAKSRSELMEKWQGKGRKAESAASNDGPRGPRGPRGSRIRCPRVKCHNMH